MACLDNQDINTAGNPHHGQHHSQRRQQHRRLSPGKHRLLTVLGNPSDPHKFPVSKLQPICCQINLLQIHFHHVKPRLKWLIVF